GKGAVRPDVAFVDEPFGANLTNEARRPWFGEPSPGELAALHLGEDGGGGEGVDFDLTAVFGALEPVRSEEFSERHVLGRSDLRRRELSAGKVGRGADSRIDHERSATRSAPRNDAEGAVAVPRLCEDHGSRTGDRKIDRLSEQCFRHPGAGAEDARLDSQW